MQNRRMSEPAALPEQPPSIFHRIGLAFSALASGLSHRVQQVNEFIASTLGISATRVFQVEIGGISVLAFTMMQIGEHLAAIVLWVVLCVLWVAKACLWPGIENHRYTIVLKIVYISGVIILCSTLITVTGARKGNEPWTNLEKITIPRLMAHNEQLYPPWFGSDARIAWPQTMFPVPERTPHRTPKSVETPTPLSKPAAMTTPSQNLPNAPPVQVRVPPQQAPSPTISAYKELEKAWQDVGSINGDWLMECSRISDVAGRKDNEFDGERYRDVELTNLDKEMQPRWKLIKQEVEKAHADAVEHMRLLQPTIWVPNSVTKDKITFGKAMEEADIPVREALENGTGNFGKLENRFKKLQAYLEDLYKQLGDYPEQ